MHYIHIICLRVCLALNVSWQNTWRTIARYTWLESDSTLVTPGSSEGSAQSKSHNRPSISGSALVIVIITRERTPQFPFPYHPRPSRHAAPPTPGRSIKSRGQREKDRQRGRGKAQHPKRTNEKSERGFHRLGGLG